MRQNFIGQGPVILFPSLRPVLKEIKVRAPTIFISNLCDDLSFV